MQKIEIEDKTFELFLEEETIGKRIRLIGIQLNVDYEDKCPVFLGVLNGSFLFMADLLKEIDGSCETEFIKVSSYHGESTTGKVKQVIGLPENLAGRDVIVVEDIVDTGLTMEFILKKLRALKPASIKVCTLLSKPKALKSPVEELEYVGFEIPNDFVVGYGLDYKGLGRNLRSIYRLTKS